MTAVLDSSAFSALIERRYNKLYHYPLIAEFRLGGADERESPDSGRLPDLNSTHPMNKALEIILVLVMIGTTLAFGGVEPVAYSLMELALFTALFLLLLNQTRQGRIHLWLPIWPLIFALIGFFQIVPLPSSWVMNRLQIGRLDGALAGLWPQGWAFSTLSIYPHDTLVMLFKFLAYLSAFVLAAYFFDSRKGKSIIIGGLILIGSLEAAYGIVQYASGSQMIFGYTKKYFALEATGTYINRNHFAGVLELTVPFGVAMAFYSFQKVNESRSNGTHSRRPRNTGLVPSNFEILFYFFLTVMILVGLLFSRSRAGILAVVIGLIFVGLLGYIKLQRKIWTLAVLFILVSVMGYGLWVGLGPVLLRFEQTPGTKDLSSEGRIFLFRDETRLIRDHWLAGTGLGTFGIAIHAYQTNMVDREIVSAHNDYFEAASDMGLPGALLLFLPIFYLFFKLTDSFLDDPRLYRRSITLGCLGSCVAILIHSAVDFNLQIPANALIFAVVLGVGYKIAIVEYRSVESDLFRQSGGTPRL